MRNLSLASLGSLKARPSGASDAVAFGVIAADLYSKKISRSMLGAWFCSASASSGFAPDAAAGGDLGPAGEPTWPGCCAGAGVAVGAGGCGVGGDGVAGEAGALVAAGTGAGAAGAVAGGGAAGAVLRDPPLSLSIRSSTAL